MSVGIEAINFYAGVASVDVQAIFEKRGLDLKRFDNLMLKRKSVALPCEDPVSYAVNAAKPLIQQLSEEARKNIELVITATESGLDFGKSLSTYVHDHLELGKGCRLFEIKQACYGGTAAMQMAAHFVASSAPGTKALVIASDISRAAIRGTYIEPSQGAGAVAMLIGNQPDVLELDFGANGFCSYEVMDTCRPNIEIETGDSDLSLLSYLDCLEQSFRAYHQKVEGSDFQDTFDYLAFHTPFGGMVRGAHRMMMRKLKRMPQAESDADFEKRVAPSIHYCTQVGNIYSATLYMALCSLIDRAEIPEPRRIGLFSYGSGCSSEFFSGIITPESKLKVGKLQLQKQLDSRRMLTMDQYDTLVDRNKELVFGVKDQKIEIGPDSSLYNDQLAGRGLLILDKINNYHREYRWS